MKIVGLTEFYSERGGGVRSHLTGRNQVLCQLGAEAIVVAPGPRDDEERDPQGRLRVVRVAGPSVPYDPTYHLMLRMDKVRTVITRERPDVLEVHSPYLAALCALGTPSARFKLRTLVWHADFVDTYIRVFLEHHLSSKTTDVLVGPVWKAVRALAARCDATLVAGRTQAAKLRNIGLPRVVHHPFGVEKDVFSPSNRNERVRANLLAGKPKGTAIIVGLGRFAVEKQWDVVVRAFLRLRERRDAILVLFGDGPERPKLEALTYGRSDVVFPGFERNRDTLASTLASADLYVHGCPYETYGLGVTEAMAAGLPVVVPDAGGAAENAEASCDERYVPGDAVACAEALERILSRDANNTRAATLARVERVESVYDRARVGLERYSAWLDDPPRLRGPSSEQ